MNKKQNKKYLDEAPLDNYEKELKEFLDKGEFVSVPNLEETKKLLEEAAKNYKELRACLKS